MATPGEAIQSYEKKKHLIRGVVVSDRMRKTVVVAVTRIKEHPKYKKRFRVTKKHYAHDEQGEYHVGDEVIIEETRPFSHAKRWRVVERIGRREIKKEKESEEVGMASDAPKKENDGTPAS